MRARRGSGRLRAVLRTLGRVLWDLAPEVIAALDDGVITPDEVGQLAALLTSTLQGELDLRRSRRAEYKEGAAP